MTRTPTTGTPIAGTTTTGTATARPRQGTRQGLGPGLLMNAAFSLATGLLLAAVPGTVGNWLGVSVDGWLRLFGAALITHAALLLWVNSRENQIPLAKINLALIAPYPLLMIALVVFGLVERPLGRGLVLADGAVIAIVALIQWQSLRGVSRQPEPASAA